MEASRANLQEGSTAPPTPSIKLHNSSIGSARVGSKDLSCADASGGNDTHVEAATPAPVDLDPTVTFKVGVSDFSCNKCSKIAANVHAGD